MAGYIITLVLLFMLYAVGILALRYVKANRFVNIFFPFVIFICYLCCMISMGLIAGIKDWNFTNTLPTANVSPFMYCLTPFIFLFPKKIRTHLLGLVALLSVGMLGAGAINCVFNIIRDYRFHWEIALDTFTHVALSWFGVYLVKTKQINLNGKQCVISGSIIVLVAIVMLLLNLLLHTSFFGLSLYGNHNIYTVVLCESGYVSASVYFLGLCLVLGMGAVYQKLLNSEIRKIKK